MVLLAVFILEDALSVWTNLGKHSLFVGLYVSSIKTGTRRIIRLDELSSVARLERRTKEGSSSTRIMHLVPVFTLETNNQTNNECLPKFLQTDYGSCSIKTAISVHLQITSMCIRRKHVEYFFLSRKFAVVERRRKKKKHDSRITTIRSLVNTT